MTTDPEIERAVRITKAIRADDSDPPGFALWKPWALELADGVDALARRLEAAETALQKVIDYVPDGFVSPMDDEDSMNYRAIARAYFAAHPAATEPTSDDTGCHCEECDDTGCMCLRMRDWQSIEDGCRGGCPYCKKNACSEPTPGKEQR